MANSKKLAEIDTAINQIPDLESRFSIIINTYKDEKEKKKKNPHYSPAGWRNIVLNQCPDFFKGNTAKWLALVAFYKQTFKKKPVKEKKIKSGTQLSFSF